MITERLIEYQHQGVLLEGYLAYDDDLSTPLPGVMISHAWAGRDEFACSKARAMAELGYAGFALDLYGKGIRGRNPEENTRLMQPFMADRSMLQSRMTASLETLRTSPDVDAGRIAAMGFCFGGLCVLDLARTGADIRGAVSVHGFFNPPGNTGGNKITARLLCLHGNDDPMVSFDSLNAARREFSVAGADWQFHIYGNTQHAFTNPQARDHQRGTVYKAEADRRAWTAIRNFMEEIF
jgi:dienelactone hydrolase